MWNSIILIYRWDQWRCLLALYHLMATKEHDSPNPCLLTVSRVLSPLTGQLLVCWLTKTKHWLLITQCFAIFIFCTEFVSFHLIWSHNTTCQTTGVSGLQCDPDPSLSSHLSWDLQRHHCQGGWQDGRENLLNRNVQLIIGSRCLVIIVTASFLIVLEPY